MKHPLVVLQMFQAKILFLKNVIKIWRYDTGRNHHNFIEWGVQIKSKHNPWGASISPLIS